MIEGPQALWGPSNFTERDGSLLVGSRGAERGLVLLRARIESLRQVLGLSGAKAIGVFARSGLA
jgi:hypothetical protein